MTIHARRHEPGIHRQLTTCSGVLPLSQTAAVPYLGVRIHTILVIHRQLTTCSGVLPLSQTAAVPYLGVRIHTILVALLSKNAPYEASLLPFAAPCHAGILGHGHCGGSLCGDLC